MCATWLGGMCHSGSFNYAVAILRCMCMYMGYCTIKFYTVECECGVMGSQYKPHVSGNHSRADATTTIGNFFPPLQAPLLCSYM